MNQQITEALNPTVSGINLSSLALVAGAVGVGLGFGLQNIVSNFISALIILEERPIAIGDRVEIGNIAGQVTQVVSMRRACVQVIRLRPNQTNKTIRGET